MAGRRRGPCRFPNPDPAADVSRAPPLPRAHKLLIEVSVIEHQPATRIPDPDDLSTERVFLDARNHSAACRQHGRAATGEDVDAFMLASASIALRAEPALHVAGCGVRDGKV